MSEENWRVDIIATSGKRWVTNGLEYATEEVANAEGRRLLAQAPLVEKVRVVPLSTKRNETYVKGSETEL